MSTNHKPMGLASLPRPPHHALPDPPLACALPNNHHHRGPGSGARNPSGYPPSQRHPDRSCPPIPDASRARHPPPGSGHRWDRDLSASGRDRPGARPVGRDYAAADCNSGCKPHSPMMHPTFSHHSTATHQPHQSWGPSYEESRRLAGSQSGNSTSHSHPSPASTSSGSTSSLRTPPDLLLNGNTIGHVYPNWKSSSPQHSMLALNSWSGLAVRRPIATRHMKVAEIERRQKLLDSLPEDPPFSLPSPPHTPTSSPRKKGKARGPKDFEEAAHVEAGEVAEAEAVKPAKCTSEVMRSEKRNSNDAMAPQDLPIKSGRKRRHSEAEDTDDSIKRRTKADRSASRASPSRHNNGARARSPPSANRTQKCEEEDGELRDASNHLSTPAGSSCPTKSTATPRKAKSARRSPLPLTVWTREQLGHTATVYRNCGRERKHVGDQLAEKAASSVPSFASPSSNEIAALEQLDAVLLFCYAFYLSDQEKGAGSCLANNWLSLFGLLRYVTNAHSRFRNDGLVGLCRLIEASVLRILHTHDQKLLRNRIATLARPETPADAAASETWATLSEGFVKLASDLERSDRLASQASQWLSIGALRRDFPETWSMILDKDDDELFSADGTALRVDPGTWPNAETFAWPIGPTTPISHLVCFGRNLIREHARKRGLDFTPVSIQARP
ncbi:hypothetical protein ACQY0O_007385 [Thecaphora frezii]